MYILLTSSLPLPMRNPQTIYARTCWLLLIWIKRLSELNYYNTVNEIKYSGSIKHNIYYLLHGLWRNQLSVRAKNSISLYLNGQPLSTFNVLFYSIKPVVRLIIIWQANIVDVTTVLSPNSSKNATKKIPYDCVKPEVTNKDQNVPEIVITSYL